MVGSPLLVGEASARGPRHVPNLRSNPATDARDALEIIPLTIHVAVEHGQPVLDSIAIARWVERGNAMLEPHGLRLGIRSIRILDDGPIDVIRQRHRRTLAREAPRDGSLHVFVVRNVELGPSPRADRRVRGIYWRYHGLARGLSRREYVVVGREAPSTTLVHEIGHVLGLRHSSATNNVMCSCRRGPGIGFTRGQGRSLRVGVRRFHRRQLMALR